MSHFVPITQGTSKRSNSNFINWLFTWMQFYVSKDVTPRGILVLCT